MRGKKNYKKKKIDNEKQHESKATLDMNTRRDLAPIPL